MRQQFSNAARRMRGQSFEHVPQVAIRVVSVEPGRLNQAHHGRSPLSGAQRYGEQPVGSSQRNGSNPILYPVVVYGHSAVVEKSDQRRPALKAVVDRFGDGRVISRALSLQQQPLVQLVRDRPRLRYAKLLSLLGTERLRLALQLVE